MPNTQENGLIKVLGAFWHVEKKESRFEFEFKTISGRKRKKVLRLPEIEEFSVFRRTMVEAGFSFSGLRAADLHGALTRQCRRAAEDRKSERRLTSELGWHQGVFVLPGSTFPAGGRLAFEREHGRYYAHARIAGTLKAWQDKVAAPAVCSSRMVTAILAAFAAPLLLLSGRRAGGFGLSFSGTTSTGKTTALRLAKSVIDEPTPDGWGMSRSGGTAVLCGYTDLPVFFDETAAVRGSKRGNSTIVTEMTDVLSGGKPDLLHPDWQPKGRLEGGGGAIRSVLLATTEGKLDPWRRQGERARLIEVPAERPGSFGVIDHPERARPAIDSKTKAGEHIERLDRAVAQNYGHALPRLVEQLVAHRAKVPGWIEQYTAEFRRAARGVDRDGWARRMLACFALIYAAGMLARRFGIVPWSEGVVRDAVLRCWEDAMRAAATPEARAAEAAARVRRWIVGAKRVATVGRDFHPEKVAGYEVIHDRDRGEPVVLVQRDRLVAAAGGEAALVAALDHMKQKGWLVPNQEGAATRQKRFHGTAQKLRFVYVRPAFLRQAAASRG